MPHEYDEIGHSFLKSTLSLSHLTFLDCNLKAALHLNTCLFLNIHDQNQIPIRCKITVKVEKLWTSVLPCSLILKHGLQNSFPKNI